MHLGKVLRTLDTIETIQQLLATSGFSAALTCLIAANKFFRMSNLGLLGCVFAHTTLHTFFAQMQICCIVAGIFFYTPKGHFNGTRDYLIQKVAIMSHDDESALPTIQIGF